MTIDRLMARPLGPIVRLGPSSGGIRRRRRVGVRRQQRARIGLLALAFFVSAVSLATSVLIERDDRSELPAPRLDASRDAALAPVGFATPKMRARYRYSVIPHGVFSAQELKAAIEGDAVVAAHYQTFDAARATLVALEQTRLAYVSYRLRDRVFWTRHPVRLPAGELLLSDGSDVVRARCGNRISAMPGATAIDEPDPILLDTPVESDPPVDDPVVAAEAVPGVPVLLLSSPTVVGSGEPAVQSQRTDHPGPVAEPGPTEGAPVILFPGPIRTPGPRVRSVPEPTSVLLMTAGLVGIGLRRRMLARRRNRTS